MTFLNAATLAIFAVLPLVMFFQPLSRRFLILWVLALALPREFNVRWGPVSFCLTDSAFLGFVLPEMLAFAKEGWKKSRLSHGSAFAWGALGLLLVGTLTHLGLEGISNPRFFMRSMLVYGSFPILLLAVRRSGLRWNFTHTFSLMACLGLLSSGVLLILLVPGWEEAYLRSTYNLRGVSSDLGYFLPDGMGIRTDPQAIARGLARIRFIDFIGGCPIGLVFPFFFPILLGIRPTSKRQELLVFAVFALLCFGSLSMVSRTIFFGIFAGLCACGILFSGDARRRVLVAFGIFLVLALATPLGERNWNRFSLLKNKGLEGISDQGPGSTKDEFQIYDSRFPIWKAALSQIAQHPLTGQGPDRSLVFPYGTKTAESNYVDSLYLTLALNWGLGALLFFLVWLGQLALLWWKAWPSLRGREDMEGLFLRGFVPAAAVFLFVCVFQFPLRNISFTLFLACYLGLMLNSLEAGSARVES